MNPEAASTASFQIIHLSQSSPASPSPTSLSIANANSFKTTYIFLFQNILHLSFPHFIKEPPQPQVGFLHLAQLLLVVWNACPRTWLAHGSIKPFFSNAFSLKGVLINIQNQLVKGHYYIEMLTGIA